MTLDYLIFDYSEDTDGSGTFEAMASTTPAQAHLARAEAQQVLDWVGQHFPHGPGPLEEGFDWDHDLSDTLAADGWHTVTLSISGSPAFCDGFRQQFPTE